MKMWRWRRLKLLQIWNHLLLEMFKFHILDLLLRHYLFYWCNWLIVEILFTFVLNLIWLCRIFVKIVILLKLGSRTGLFDPGGVDQFFKFVEECGAGWPGLLSMRTYANRLYVGRVNNICFCLPLSNIHSLQFGLSETLLHKSQLWFCKYIILFGDFVI